MTPVLSDEGICHLLRRPQEEWLWAGVDEDTNWVWDMLGVKGLISH